MTKLLTTLHAFREAEGQRRGLGRALTMEDAAALIVGLDGTSPNRSTWHAWEHRRKVPAPNFMPALCALIGASADIFYAASDGTGQQATPADGKLSSAGRSGSRKKFPPFAAIHRHGFVRVAGNSQESFDQDAGFLWQ